MLAENHIKYVEEKQEDREEAENKTFTEVLQHENQRFEVLQIERGHTDDGPHGLTKLLRT